MLLDSFLWVFLLASVNNCIPLKTLLVTFNNTIYVTTSIQDTVIWRSDKKNGIDEILKCRKYIFLKCLQITFEVM